MTERSPKDRWRDAEAPSQPAARSSSRDLAPASVAVPILERRRRATNAGQPARVTLLARDPAQGGLGLGEDLPVEGSWDRARWVNEVRRFETAWDVDAPRSTRDLPAGQVERRRTPETPTLEFPSVTLVVYEWQNAEPGTLSWRFPSVHAAVHAARAIRNAVRWAVVGGSEHNLARARELGLVLAEPELAVGLKL